MTKIKNNELTHSGNSGTSNIILGSSGEVTPSKLKIGSDAAGDIAYYNGTQYVRLAKGSDGQVLKLASGVPSWAADAGGLYSSWAHVYELAASAGDDGGTFTSGAMRTRTLNQEEDPDGIVSISSNQFTLGAGTYRIAWNAPAFKVGAHTSQLYNVTDTSVAARGSIAESHAGGDYAQTSSFGVSRITIGGSKAFEIQHQGASTRADDGFGYAMGGQTYKFTTVEILKEA